MTGDYKISLDDGQALTLSKMTYTTDQIKLTIEHNSQDVKEQKFTFSVESVEDVHGSHDDSGAYNMNVKSKKADTDEMMAIKEI